MRTNLYSYTFLKSQKESEIKKNYENRYEGCDEVEKKP